MTRPSSLADLASIYDSQPISGMRNRIINGDMRIDQRNAGAAQNITFAAVYSIDRWAIGSGAPVSGTLTGQRIATNTPGESQFCLRLARTAGTYTSFLSAGQVIETINCYDLAGKTVTVSFRARAGSAYSGGSINSWVRIGTAADQGIAAAYAGTWTGWAQVTSNTFSLSTSFQTFIYTATIPANVQEIAVAFNTGSFTGTGSANDFIDITDVQLEAGPFATPFERRHFGHEVQLCQRYYSKNSDLNVVATNGANYLATGMFNAGIAGVYSTGAAYSDFIHFPVPMRAPPTTITFINTNLPSSPAAGQWSIYNNSNWINIGVSIQSVTSQGFNTNMSGSIGVTGGQPLYYAWTANAEL